MTDEAILAELRRPGCQTMEQFVYDNFSKYDSAEKKRLYAEADRLLRERDAIELQLEAKQRELDQNWKKFQEEIVRLYAHRLCTHNSMVPTGDPTHAWKCERCGYVYGQHQGIPDSQYCEQASC